MGVIDDLRRRVCGLAGGHGDPTRRRHVLTGIPALDAALPGGGLPAGALVEVRGDREPPWTLALLFARAALEADPAAEAVLVDAAPGGDPGTRARLYPPGIAALGLDLARVVLVSPRTEREAAWAFAEALASRDVAVAVGAAAAGSLADGRRLQLAAETGGGIGLLLGIRAGESAGRVAARAKGGGGARATGPPGAAVRLHVWGAMPRAEEDLEMERLDVEVVRCRGAPLLEVGAARVEIDRAALPRGRVSLFSR